MPAARAAVLLGTMGEKQFRWQTQRQQQPRLLQLARKFVPETASLLQGKGQLTGKEIK